MFFYLIANEKEFKTLCNCDIFNNPKLLLKWEVIKTPLFLLIHAIAFVLLMSEDSNNCKKNFFIYLYKNKIFKIIFNKILHKIFYVKKYSYIYNFYIDKETNSLKEGIKHSFDTAEEYYQYCDDHTGGFIMNIFQKIFYTICLILYFLFSIFILFLYFYFVEKFKKVNLIKIMFNIFVLEFILFFIVFIPISYGIDSFTIIFLSYLGNIKLNSPNNTNLLLSNNIILNKLIFTLENEELSFIIKPIQYVVFIILVLVILIYFGNKIIYQYEKYLIIIFILILIFLLLTSDIITELCPILQLKPEYVGAKD